MFGMKYSSIPIVIISTLLIGAGCVDIRSFISRSVPITNVQNDVSTSTEPTIKQENPFAWKFLQKGIERGEQSTIRDGWSKRLIVYRFDPSIVSFRLVNAEKNKSIRAWRDDIPQALFIINGVYFNEDATPTGSLRINGVEYSKSKFDADKSGIFEFDGVPSIVETTNTPELMTAASSSAQSYPFLITSGVSSIEKDSEQLARRSFIGTDKNGFVYLGVYPDSEISLFELSRSLIALPIEWNHVLNLDGGTSTSFFSRISGSLEIEDGFSAIPNVIVAEPIY
jgi:hypothetical protein